MRINKGPAEHPEFRCRLVAQQLGYGERLDELLAGTPSLTIVELLRFRAAEKGLGIMVFGVKTAFFYGATRDATSTSNSRGRTRRLGAGSSWASCRSHVWDQGRTMNLGDAEGTDDEDGVRGQRLQPVGLSGREEEDHCRHPCG